MSTAFVFSGGGSLGAIQVGMLQALAERGVRPDLLVGTSAGAVNAGFISGRGTSRAALDDLAAIWVGLRRRDIFPMRPLHQLIAGVGSARIPVHLVATDLLSGAEVLLSLRRHPRCWRARPTPAYSPRYAAAL